MPKLLPSGVDTTVKVLSKQGFGPKKIMHALSQQNITIDRKTIYNILKNKGITRLALSENQEKPKFKRVRLIRTLDTIRKVMKMASGPNPKT
jgi:IS30 family transposase